MSFGLLTPSMLQALAPYVKGKTVYDIGAGDCRMAAVLRSIGAARVWCIDPKPEEGTLPSKVEVIKAYLHELRPPAKLEVVFVSWPLNRHIETLDEWVTKADVAVYVGCNFDGTACGSPALFNAMLRRDLVVHVPNRTNTMIVLTGHRDTPREPTPEENAALSAHIQHMPF